jgi:hypothetical protein
MKALWLLPCLALSLTAADISGKWAGTIEVEDTASGSTINTNITAEFQQHAEAISGKIGSHQYDEAEPIKNAKLAGGKQFTFEVFTPDSDVPLKFALTLDGNQMDGTMQGQIFDGPIKGTVHLAKTP